MKEDTIEVPKDVIKGLYRIMCNLSYSMSNYEVYPEVMDEMANAQRWVLNYGKKNNIDPRGFDEHMNNNKN